MVDAVMSENSFVKVMDMVSQHLFLLLRKWKFKSTVAKQSSGK